MWVKYQEGSTIGESGSESGNIMFDEEHVDGARITLEQNCHSNIPFAITGGMYGTMVHTVFVSNKDEAILKYNEMKLGIEAGLRIGKFGKDAEWSLWLKKFRDQY